MGVNKHGVNRVPGRPSGSFATIILVIASFFSSDGDAIYTLMLLHF